MQTDHLFWEKKSSKLHSFVAGHPRHTTPDLADRWRGSFWVHLAAPGPQNAAKTLNETDAHS